MKISRRIVLLFIVCFTSSFCVNAQTPDFERQIREEPDNVQLLLEAGIYFHKIGGMKEDKNAVKQAEKNLKQLLELQPDHALAMVYYGSTLTLKARDAFLPWDKIKWVKRGIEQMDQAVLLEPDNPEVRLLRGINNGSLPAFFNRLSTALEDFAHIERLHKEHPLDMSKTFWLPFYYNYGCALAKNQKYASAETCYLKTIDIDPESNYARFARLNLQNMKETKDAE